MCRSIKTLRRPAPPVTPEEITAASLQFVRKISGFRKPSQANQAAFDAAVDEVSTAMTRLLEKIHVELAAPDPGISEHSSHIQ